MNPTAHRRRGRRLPLGLAVVQLFAAVGVAVAPAAPVAAAAPVSAAAPDPSLLGTAPHHAAGSCWEIKQERPEAPDGPYWLLTPSMAEPKRFYCDQTMGGGGWVLVGKGRHGWTMDDEGTGRGAALLSPAFNGFEDTHQYSARLIDQLLDGERPVDLAEGIRVRRARDTGGTSWQEVRVKVDTRQTGWSWAFGAKFGVDTWSFAPGGSSAGSGPVSGTGGTSDYPGTGSSWARLRTFPNAETGWKTGFAYGTGVTGTTSPSSYLWSRANGAGPAVPVAQVYLRPRITSDDADFDPLPAGGTDRIQRRAHHESDADVLPWGVSGLAGDPSREGSVEVQELLEAHGRIYVGGNFKYVQRDAAGGSQVEQPFLAAFDLVTGAWVTSFRPVLDEQVRSLELSPTGSIIAGGDFSRANGAPATGVVALDPSTGATDTTFRLALENRVTGGVVRVWALETLGNKLYLGGTFTHLKGGSRGVFSYMRNLGRVRATDGLNQEGWNPEMNGSVIALDASDDGARIYAAGHFTKSRGVTVRRVAAVLAQFETRSDGTVQHLARPAWSPVWSANADYQQAIVEAGGNVWAGGSEHSIFGFDSGTFERISTTITHAKGDMQTLTADGDLFYAGSHSNNQYAYHGATTWSGAGPGGDPWTAAHTQHWVGAFDSRTGAALAEFAPSFRMRKGSGIWASTIDSRGRLWVGGDIKTVRTRSSAAQWSGGFSRFAPRDATAPVTPGNLRVVSRSSSSVTLAWNGVSDPSGVHYQVLRDDRPVAVTSQTSVTIPVGRAPGAVERYFVRAADAVGNVSASTGALPVEVTAAHPVNLVDEDSAWTWRYAGGGPGAGWHRVGFDDTGWRRAGAAPLGFAPGGSAGHLATDIDRFARPTARPITAYFRQTFVVREPERLSQVVATGIADDGAVFYVNGVEIGRQNMRGGAVTPTTFAPAARREWTAEAHPAVLTVPARLLVDGTNVIAAETHVNYRATPDLTFSLSLDAVRR